MYVDEAKTLVSEKLVKVVVAIVVVPRVTTYPWIKKLSVAVDQEILT